jgi:hypothetical protein
MTAAPEVIRTANRLRANEGRPVILDGLAVQVAGWAGIHLDRSDAIVPVHGLAAWDADRLGQPVRGRGVLRRHAEVNDPVTGIASLALTGTTVEPRPQPDDGRLRTAPALHAAEGSVVEL